MEVEKRSSKGGFLQLFDWNLKSRKKLFSNKHEHSENIKPGNENGDGSAISRLQQVHDNGRVPGARINSDMPFHSATSVGGSEGYGTKAPGVVARLMGLDSLPTSNVPDPYNTLSFESQSFRDPNYFNGTTDFPNEHQIVIYESMRNKLDGMPKNPLELRLQKMQRPIERFQTEVLPQKLARPISITHSRLLSPIKSPGLMPPKNAAYIMEAAAKIIEQSPRSTVKDKLPSFWSSSVPLRIHDLKEKMEVAQRSSRIAEMSNQQNPTMHVKRQPREKGDMHLLKSSEASKAVPQTLKTKEKSASNAVQTKSKTHKRDGMTSGGRHSVNQKEQSETKPSHTNKNQPNTRKSTQKRSSSSRSSDVLRQNDQKQNCMSNKDKESQKSSISNQKDGKVLPRSDITRTGKVVNKIVVNTSLGPGKTNSMTIDSRKDSSEFGVKKFPGKKRSNSVGIRSGKSAANNVRINKEESTVKCNTATEGSTNWDTVDRKNPMDVVSFTFTSPIKKSLSESNSSAQAIEKNKSLSLISSPGDNDTSSKYSTVSSSGFDVVGSDALSVLLEQKLKELASRVELSDEDKVGAQFLSSAANSFQDSVPTLNSLDNPSVHTKGLQVDLPQDNRDVGYNSHRSSIDDLTFRASQSWLRSEETGADSCHSNNKSGPVSSVEEPSLSEASCNSLDSNRSYSSEVSDGKCCISTEADEVSDWSSGRAPQLTDGDLDLADSASSMTVGAIRSKDTTLTLTLTNFKESYHWELEYIRNIIINADLMLEEFTLGQVHKIIEPNLFDQLESHIIESNRNLEEPFKVARKALFDCVEECLELRCKRVFCGSFKAWAKWKALFRRIDNLAEDLSREILGWTNMVDLLVDEVADRDMSTQNGKWVEFETDTFEEGIEIEKEILSSLVDELVDDFLF